MQSDRRTFLTTALSASRLAHFRDLCLLGAAGALSHAMAAPNRTASTVLGLASAYELQDKPEQRERTLRAMTHIFRQQLLVDAGTKSVADAAKEVRDTIFKEQHYDSETFGAAAKFLEGNADSAFYRTTLEKSAIAGVLGAIGGWVSAAEILTGPPGWALLGALAIAGVGADVLIEELGSHSLSKPDDAAVLGLSAWAGSSFYQMVEASPNMMNLAADLWQSGIIAVDPAKSASQALESLPAHVRKVAKPHIDPPTTVPPTKNATVDELKQALVEGFADFNKQANEFFNTMKEERNKAVRASQEAMVRQQVEYMAGELNGVGIIGNFVLSRIFGDQVAGRNFQTVISAGVTAYVALMTPGIGTVALAGQLVSAISQVVGLFDNSDAQASVFRQIGTTLNGMVQQLNRISAQQMQILSDLEQIYADVLTNQARITQVKQQLAALAISNSEEHMALERQTYDSTFDEFQSLLANHTSASIQTDNTLRNEYENDVSNFYTYASKTSADKIYADNKTSLFTSEQWRDEIRARVRCDRLFGLLPHVAGQLGITLPVMPGQPDYVPVNPTAWAEGVNSFVMGRCAAPTINLADDEARLQRLWLDGQYARELILRLTTPKALTAVADQLLKAVGVPDESDWNLKLLADSVSFLGQIYKAAVDYDSKNVPRNITAVGSPTGIYWLWGSGQGSWGNGQTPLKAVNYNPDYFKILLDGKLIVSENCKPLSLPPGPEYTNCTYRVTVDGPRKDSLLVPGPVSVLAIGGNSPVHLFYPAIASSPSSLQAHNPAELQRFSLDIVLGSIARPIAQRDMAKAISNYMKPFASKFPDLEYWGEVLRLLELLVSWRAAKAETSEILLLSNCSGPFTPAEIYGYVGAFINDQLSYSGYWPLEVTRFVETAIRDTVEFLRALSTQTPPDKSVPTVDETLRRLAGYMHVRGFTPMTLT